MYSFFSGSNCEGQILCSLPVKADDTPTRVCESYIILTGFFLTGVSRIYFWFVKSCVVADCRIREILCLLKRDLLGMLFKTAYFFIIDFIPCFEWSVKAICTGASSSGRGREKRNVLMRRLILGCLEGETAVPSSNSSSFMTVCNYRVIA